MKNLISTNKISSLLGLGLAAGMIFSAAAFPERAISAALYVRFLGVTLGIFSLILLGRSILKDETNRVKWIKDPAAFAITIGAIILYVALLQLLGFFIASFIFMVGLAWLLGFRKLLPLILGSAGLLGFIYLIFIKFLAVPVPSGLF